MSKCHIVGNHMHWLINFYFCTFLVHLSQLLNGVIVLPFSIEAAISVCILCRVELHLLQILTFILKNYRTRLTLHYRDTNDCPCQILDETESLTRTGLTLVHL